MADFGQVDYKKVQKYLDVWPELQEEITKVLNSNKLKELHPGVENFVVVQYFMVRKNVPVESRISSIISNLLTQVDGYSTQITNGDGTEIGTFYAVYAPTDVGYMFFETDTLLAFIPISIG